MAGPDHVATHNASATVLAQIVIDVDEHEGQALLGFARRLGLTNEQADDAVQEVLLRLFRTLTSGTAVSDPKAWSYRTVYRIAMDEHRLRRRINGLRERLGLTEERRAQEDIATRMSLWRDVDQLPARQRQIVYLRYKADLPFDDIAAIMGITAGGARAGANKALKSLRVVLDREDPS
jgi:RNA polymerase sigma-70 factor (ECF subfamily)